MRIPTNRPSGKFLNVRVAAKVTDAARLIRHARALWTEAGGLLATAPRTVEESLIVAMVTHADGTPPAEYGVAAQAQCTTAPSVFEKLNAAAIAPIAEEEKRRFVLSEAPREFEVVVGQDYFHRARVRVVARSPEEAEREALARLGDIELRLVEPVEGTSFAEVVTPA
jgi:hypothetical protein